MPDRTTTMPHMVGVRLTPADKAKLATLCAHTQRSESDLLRTLIRLARPVDVSPVWFGSAPAQEVPCADE